jgi:hypothetical protein
MHKKDKKQLLQLGLRIQEVPKSGVHVLETAENLFLKLHPRPLNDNHFRARQRSKAWIMDDKRKCYK